MPVSSPFDCLQAMLDRHVRASNVIKLQSISHVGFPLQETDDFLYKGASPCSPLSENPLLALANTTARPAPNNTFFLLVYRQMNFAPSEMFVAHDGTQDQKYTLPSLVGRLFVSTGILAARPCLVLTVSFNETFIAQHPGSMMERLLSPTSSKFQAERRDLAVLVSHLEHIAPLLYKEARDVVCAPVLYGFSLFELRALRQRVDQALPYAVCAEAADEEEEEEVGPAM